MQNKIKRFNLGFGYFGVPEQCEDGKYCEYDALEISLKEVEEEYTSYLQEILLPNVEWHYQQRIFILVLMQVCLLPFAILGLMKVFA